MLVEGWLSDKLRRFWGAPQLLFLEKTTWPPSPLFAGKPAVIDLLTMEKTWNEGDEMIQTLQSNSRWLLVTLWRLVEGLDVSFADIEVLEVFIKSLEVWKNRFTKTSSFRGAKLKPGKSTDDTDASKSVRLHCFQSSAHPHVLVGGLLSDYLRTGVNTKMSALLGSQGSNKILCPTNEMILAHSTSINLGFLYLSLP